MAIPRSPFVLRKHSLPQLTVLAEAVEMARTQTTIALTPPGHIALEPRERGATDYAYWVRYEAGKQVRQYLGPIGSEKHLQAEAQLAELKRFQAQAKDLRKLGFEAVEHDAALVIAQLANVGVFGGGGMLIGTRAFGSILNHLGYKATPFLATRDAIKVDLLVPSRVSSKPYQVVPVSELDAHATALPFLDYLIAESWPTIVIGRDHLIPVAVPLPARYCFHKLTVADLRSGADNPKIEKDIVQAAILAAILTEEDPDALGAAAAALPAAMRKHGRTLLPKLEAVLGRQHPEALALMRDALV